MPTGTPSQPFRVDLLSKSEYYPYGMVIDELSYQNGNTRFGYNGKENDNEVKGGVGKQQDYGMRIYDPRVARFLSTDPLIVHQQQYQYLTPYQFASNTPIQAIDLDGLEAYIVTETIGTGHTYLVTVDKNDVKVYNFGRYGRVDWDQSGAGILQILQGPAALSYINNGLTKLNAQVFKLNNVSTDKLDKAISNDFLKGEVEINGQLDIFDGNSELDEYNLILNNCTTKSCDWVKEAGGNDIFKNTLLGVEYSEKFVIPSSLESYLLDKVENKSTLIIKANDELKSIVKDLLPKSQIKSGGSSGETSGSSGKSVGSSSNSSSGSISTGSSLNEKD